ncbi:AmmeMemoRadiSam system protein B [Ferrigenium sp. UT5]|uniref:AmmeMemoRadiSam system protein B n=1 Tax=Ferrigenium sp. UT5 TaxID=3242105 RepID=UPI00354B7249
MSANRPPAVAGSFYPADPGRLTLELRHFLEAVKPVRFPHPNPLPEGEGAGGLLREFRVKALIVPHAGYMYSGAIAASAYATLRPIAARIRRVVLLGPTHRVAVSGLALPAATTFTTPLGEIKLDTGAMRELARLPQVVVSDAVHAQEHSLEVQLPFLQTVLQDFTLVPLAVGEATAGEVAAVLEQVWGGAETLIVISSDLSHYLPAEVAQRIDRATADEILHLHPVPSHQQACGATPVNGLLLAARRHHLVPHLLDLRNSGDTAGPHDSVVGYAAFALTGENDHVH